MITNRVLKNMTTNELKKKIDEFWEFHHTSRRMLAAQAYSQPEEPGGKRPGEVGSKLCHWLNENVVIRLYALLDYCGVYDYEIDPNDPLGKKLYALCAARNIFAHETGRFGMDEREWQFNLWLEAFYPGRSRKDFKGDEFPLDIVGVLQPLKDACKEYVDQINLTPPARLQGGKKCPPPKSGL